MFARKTDLKLTPVQLNEVLQNAFEIFSQQLKVRGIEVVWDLDPDLPKIKGDSGRLEQVFINLILNARDAIEENWAESDPRSGEKCITLKTKRQGGRVIAEVRDSGPGIPEANINKIFEPFFTTKEVGKGTGLGLSISYGIVKDCNGDIRAESLPGGGACFRLTFPVSSEEVLKSAP
jgi:histidine kinase